MPETAYHPVACEVYDELTARAVLRRRCTVTYRGGDGAERRTEDHIADVYTRGREEFVRFRDGLVVRLDHLLTIDGVPLPGSC